MRLVVPAIIVKIQIENEPCQSVNFRHWHSLSMSRVTLYPKGYNHPFSVLSPVKGFMLIPLKNKPPLRAAEMCG
ncbi:hypothetical protein Dda3937_00740 [Dickeya dadantii 3937]|uniref:Uncharacterized protein n=1 Tax=Dickeya dadantii (strain 3937) TaxID=198628 RepID=E0SHK0_DICD3|nr:hypothetical protein Dda3937_00740 [Dickeya dadantii 3937]